MKIYSILGKMQGKIGNIVVSSVNGQVVGREYNPNVANPNTALQQNTRSRFKLASQLSAAMAPVIAIRKEGNKSARNIFVKENFDSINYSLGAASINLNIVQLTKSQTAFAGFNADRSLGNVINVELNADSSALLTRVVYIGYKKLSDGALQLFDSRICDVPGEDGKFADVLRYDDGDVVLYAYGMKDLDAGITSKFGNMIAPNAENAASLLVSNTENMQSVQLTKTAGLTMMAGEDTGDSDAAEYVTIAVTSSGNGSAAGGGRYQAGQVVTLRATPTDEATFEGWHLGSPAGTRISTANPYTFTAESDITICAKFEGGPTPHYDINLTASPVEGGTVSGGGSKEEGSSCTVVATPAEGMQFDGWFENNSLVSNNPSYTFTVDRARNLVAEFAEQGESGIQSATLNNSAWNSDRTVSGAAAVSMTAASELNGKFIAVSAKATQPQIGDTLTAGSTPKEISNGAASGSFVVQSKSWLVAGPVNGNQITVEAVWPYSVSFSD